MVNATIGSYLNKGHHSKVFFYFRGLLKIGLFIMFSEIIYCQKLSDKNY